MKLENLPRNIGMESYDRARNRVRELYKDIPGVLAVLEFGTIPYPGISDMDFFIITEPDSEVTLPHLSVYPEDESYAMSHRHHLLSSHAYKLVDYLDPWFVQVQPLYDPSGRFNFTKGTFSPSGYEALSLNFIHQKLTYGCLPFLASTLSTDTLSVRHFFEEFKLFRYFLREFNNVGAPRIEDDPSLDRYDEVARNWFQLSAQEQSAAMHDVFMRYQDSIVRSYRMLLDAFSPHVRRHPSSQYSPRTAQHRQWLRAYPKSLIIDLGSDVYVYQQGYKKISAVHESARFPFPLLGKGERTTYVLPWELGATTTMHCFLRGCISDYFKRIVVTDLAELPVYENHDLLFLHHVDNMNLYETRNVRNGKFYEMTFGCRPPPDRSSSLRSSLSAGYRRMLGNIIRILSDSPMGPRFFSNSRTLFSADLK